MVSNYGGGCLVERPWKSLILAPPPYFPLKMPKPYLVFLLLLPATLILSKSLHLSIPIYNQLFNLYLLTSDTNHFSHPPLLLPQIPSFPIPCSPPLLSLPYRLTPHILMAFMPLRSSYPDVLPPLALLSITHFILIHKNFSFNKK